MPGKNPREAVDAFVEPLKDIVSCVATAKIKPERGPWRVSTRGYMYEMQTASGELVWSYHWHPTGKVGSPHAHLGHTQLAADAVLSYKAHHPTGRISLVTVNRVGILGALSSCGYRPGRARTCISRTGLPARISVIIG